ncbi:uncharacterized protein [Ptychodera flava]|uniref:uncharacterized protein n=1 Tax=Ptychodera flava TaxID=63121 RepID=UPI00396A5FC8
MVPGVNNYLTHVNLTSVLTMVLVQESLAMPIPVLVLCYHGAQCEKLSDPCQPNPCCNNGTSAQESCDAYSCSCLVCYHGIQCEQLSDPCQKTCALTMVLVQESLAMPIPVLVQDVNMVPIMNNYLTHVNLTRASTMVLVQDSLATPTPVLVQDVTMVPSVNN